MGRRPDMKYKGIYKDKKKERKRTLRNALSLRSILIVYYGLKRAVVDQAADAVVKPFSDFVVKPVRDRSTEGIGKDGENDRANDECHRNPDHTGNIFVSRVVQKVVFNHFLHEYLLSADDGYLVSALSNGFAPCGAFAVNTA